MNNAAGIPVNVCHFLAMTNIELVQKHHATMSVPDMSNTFNLSTQCIRGILKRNRWIAKPHRNPPSEWVIKQVIELAPTMQVIPLARHVGISRWNVWKILKDARIETKCKSRTPIESEYFNVDNWLDDKLFL